MNVNNHNNLGQLLGEYGWNKGKARTLLLIWLFLFFPSLLLSLAFVGLPGLIYSIYIVFRSCLRLLSTKPVILVYEHGLIDSRNGSMQVIHYSAIKNIYVSAVMSNYMLTMETHHKKKLKIDENVANIDHLRIIVEQQFVRQQLPDAIALYQEGNSVVFGNIELSQTGLITGKNTLPWSEFDNTDVQRIGKFVYLLIFQKGKKQEWGAVRRNYFPNLALFLAMINYAKATQIKQ